MSTHVQFVLFPLGERRFALPAESVTELARPDKSRTIPHNTPLITGVLVRRGRIIPVLDIAQVLIGPKAPSRRFFLIATRHFGSVNEWTAIPVTGECELVNACTIAPTASLPDYVGGLISLDGEIVEIIDIDKLAQAEAQA